MQLLLDYVNEGIWEQIASLMDAASIALEGLLGTYNERIQFQLGSVVRDFDDLSRNILNTVRIHHETVFHDFVHRQNTGAIPADPANLYACLAGSIVMCSLDAGAPQVEAELVSSNETFLFFRKEYCSCLDPG